MGQIVRTQDVYKEYFNGSERVSALKNININIEEKKLTALKGRSGSGKTTLINLIGLLDDPTSGKVFISDNEVAHMDERKKTAYRKMNYGFVFQSVALVSYMTAYENVEFMLKVSGYPRDKIKMRAEESLAFVGLQKRMNHRANELSGGEQQRVGIARAFAHKPLLILADEPTAELDSHTSLQVIRIFKELIEKESITVIMATHDPAIMEVADVVYALEDGQIVS